MTEDELKNTVSAVLKAPPEAQLYLILKKESQFVLKKADVNDKSTTKEIYRMFAEFLETTIVSNDSLIVRNLSIADDNPNVVYEYDYDHYPEELELFKQFNLLKQAETGELTDYFDFRDDNLRDLFGYMIVIGCAVNHIILLKKHYPIFLINRKTFLLKKTNQCFEQLKADDIIRMNNDAQLLRVGNTIFVLNLKVLEQNMGFTALLQRDANATVDAIEELDILDDIEVLRDTLEEPFFVKQLSQLKQASPIFKLKIAKEAIIKFAQNTPELAGKFKYSEDGSKILLTTKASKKEFLKLMNDAFLRSELTHQRYDALAKEQLTQKAD